MPTNSIFHTNPAARLLAARDGATMPALPDDWPPYWSGVANPWLIFLGPSPGNSPGSSKIASKLRLPTLGTPHPHVEHYMDSNGFWNRIREWSHEAFRLAGVFSDHTDSLSSVLVGNILAIDQGDSRKIELSELRAAIPAATRNIRWLQPRIIVTMDKRISIPLVEELVAQGMARIASAVQRIPARNQTYQYYKPRSWDLSDGTHSLRVIESPQHPTKRNFYESRVVDAFLAEHMKDVLAADSAVESLRGVRR